MDSCECMTGANISLTSTNNMLTLLACALMIYVYTVNESDNQTDNSYHYTRLFQVGTVAERLRRCPAKALWSPRVRSNRTGIVFMDLVNETGCGPPEPLVMRLTSQNALCCSRSRRNVGLADDG